MSEDARAGMNAVVAFLCVVAVLVTPWVALSEAFMASCFMGCGVPEGTSRDKANGVSVAFILGTVVSVLGIALSSYTGQRTARMLFGVVLLLTLIIGLAASVDDRPIPLPPPGTGCQEHSGGDTTCPGG